MQVAQILRQPDHVQAIADALVKEIAKPAKDAAAEVVRSADLIDYTGAIWMRENEAFAGGKLSL
jgi:hypothetical protein